MVTQAFSRWQPQPASSALERERKRKEGHVKTKTTNKGGHLHGQLVVQTPHRRVVACFQILRRKQKLVVATVFLVVTRVVPGLSVGGRFQAFSGWLVAEHREGGLTKQSGSD